MARFLLSLKSLISSASPRLLWRLALLLVIGLAPQFFGACAPPLPVMRVGGDFQLTADDGSTFTLQAQRGKVVLLFFGFAHCPDFCPTTLAKVSRALELLPAAQRSQVRTFMVTVDPERDTPAVLRTYMGGFKMGAVGLTGSVAQVQKVATLYGAMFQKSGAKTAAGYLVDHSPYVYLIDQEGKVRHYFRYKETSESIAATIRRLF